MPPRRGWGIFGLGFYKDFAPTALGKPNSLIHIKIAFAAVNLFGKCWKVFKNRLAAFVPRHNVIHFENYSWVCGRRTPSDSTFEIVSPHNKKAKPVIDAP